ncbi:hypothetical protein GUITHDRAFT_116674 [Guillardia theta CCMP2712]|uniref:Uncharacterized protein n=1 Tax=Guillardia theta (strain CCMP2712) TaxID=905079 RepID=L1ILH1_GUITC|nr:hypothetical protein GUITHDRAFT_116674 [Guillardia theta CCMP2712]EKX37096.1 hypothetical protein GUITHDRAFT_116674 [Guillardia theta CCMP2712]|eukprot:XP_005824076.1 hypothetical protein GUITHDRAFT_116674 [Guillardia theta CCMP2712]
MFVRSVSEGISSQVVQKCILRSYEEEHRLVQENARLACEVEGLKANVRSEEVWRCQIKDIRERMALYTEVMDGKCDALEEGTQRLGCQLRSISDCLSEFMSHFSWMQLENYQLKQAAETSQLKVASLEARAVEAEDQLRQAMMQQEERRLSNIDVEALERQVEEKDANIARLLHACDTKDAQLAWIEAARVAGAQEREALARAVKELEHHQLAHSRLEEKRRELEERETRLNTQVAALSEENSRLRDEVADMQHEKLKEERRGAEVREKLIRSEQHLQDKEKQAEEAMSGWEEGRRRQVELQIQGEKREEELQRLAADLDEQKRRTRELESLLSTYEKKEKTLEERCQVSLRLLSDLTDKLKKTVREKAELEEAQGSLEERVAEESSSLFEQLRRREGEIRRITDQLLDLQVKLQRAQEGYDKLSVVCKLNDQKLLEKEEAMVALALKAEHALLASAKSESLAAAELASRRSVSQQVARLSMALEEATEAKEARQREAEEERERSRFLLHQLTESDLVRQAYQQEKLRREAADTETRACRNELTRLQEKVDALIADNHMMEATKKDLAGAKSKIDEVEKNNKEMSEALRKTRERLEATEKKMKEVKDMKQRREEEVTRLRHQLLTFQEADKNRKEEVQEQSNKVQELAKATEEMKLRLKASETALTKAKGENSALMKELEDIGRRKKETQSKLEAEQARRRKEMSAMEIEMHKTQLRLEHSLLRSKIKSSKSMT